MDGAPHIVLLFLNGSFVSWMRWHTASEQTGWGNKINTKWCFVCGAERIKFCPSQSISSGPMRRKTNDLILDVLTKFPGLFCWPGTSLWQFERLKYGVIYCMKDEELSEGTSRTQTQDNFYICEERSIVHTATFLLTILIRNKNIFQPSLNYNSF